MNNRLLREKAILMVCDLQHKFMPLLYGKEGVMEAAAMMVRAANVLNIPTIVTEHNPKAFGYTCQELKRHLPPEVVPVEKTKFSMVTAPVEELLAQHSSRKQVILVGAETQVCILQTFYDLKEKGYDVYLAADSITSIRAWERSIAFRRMEKDGGILTSFQSAVFDLLKDSKDPSFKSILSIIKQCKREKAIDHL